MKQRALPAVFMRGGTSKAIMFKAADLPSDQAEWDATFLAAMGTPDPYGRQLNGMGGGVSSLSKVCVIAPSSRPDADIDYTFAQVLIKEPRVDYRGNCGNMSSAVGPFAVDEGLVQVTGNQATVRIYNTNTQKIIHSTFPVEDSQARYDGDMVIPGVAGSGAPVRLDFIQPGGATTGKLLPTGQAQDRLEVPGVGTLDVSMVDAANACVFVRAADLGVSGIELPDELERNTDLMANLMAIREAASVAMGIAESLEAARRISAVPYIGLVAPPVQAPLLSGEVIRPSEIDLTVRIISNGQPHRALPLTASLCTAVAARIEGTVVNEAAAPIPPGSAIRLGMPSGILTVGADVQPSGDTWAARSGSFYRTARRLFDGRVYF